MKKNKPIINNDNNEEIRMMLQEEMLEIIEKGMKIMIEKEVKEADQFN